MEFSWNSNAKCTEWPQYSIWTHPFLMFPPFQKSLNPQVTTNKLVNSFVYHPCPSRLTTGYRDTSFHISLNSFGFYLSPEYLLNFLWLVYSCLGRNFRFMVITFLENALNLKYVFLLMPQSPSQKNVLKIFFPKTKGVKETMICFILLKYGDDLQHLFTYIFHDL